MPRPTPLSVHIANISAQPKRRTIVTSWLPFELVVLSIAAASILGMFLGMVLKGAFG